MPFLAGINPFHHPCVVESNLDAHLASEPLQERVFFTRVILIEECFMLSAALLGEMESKLRLAAPDGSRYKHGPHGIRDWGGLNVGLIGDAYQLDCPEGTPLYKVPHWLLGLPAKGREEQPLTRAGLELVWEHIQGVTELTEPFRCKDLWWNHVLGEIRISNLSEDSWAFFTSPTNISSWHMAKRSINMWKRCMPSIAGQGQPQYHEARMQHMRNGKVRSR